MYVQAIACMCLNALVLVKSNIPAMQKSYRPAFAFVDAHLCVTVFVW